MKIYKDPEVKSKQTISEKDKYTPYTSSSMNVVVLFENVWFPLLVSLQGCPWPLLFYFCLNVNNIHCFYPYLSSADLRGLYEN